MTVVTQTFVLYFTIFVNLRVYKCGDIAECHRDYSLNPPDGILQERNTFTWLGFIQYVHETIGIPHPRLAPRVVLVQKQFVLATAKDLSRVPKQYKLGSVIFGQYERDEEECHLTANQAKLGISCGPAYLEIPFEKIIINPEYSRFGVENSLALVKLFWPLKSHYMVPVCMPTPSQRMKQRTFKSVIMIDYVSTVPSDFDAEKMAKKTLTLYTDIECRKHRKNIGSESNLSNAFCTTCCGIRTGAPIVTHARSGAFELVGLASSSGPCFTEEMRNLFNKDPPVFIDVYPYVNWIVNVITASVIPQPYPQDFKRTRAKIDRRRYRGGALRAKTPLRKYWSKRTYFFGNWCVESRSALRNNLRYFYQEQFEAVGAQPTFKAILKISCGLECTISCVQISLPNRMVTPKVEGVNGYNISILLESEWFPRYLTFTVVLQGKQTTAKDLEIFKHEFPQPGIWY